MPALVRRLSRTDTVSGWALVSPAAILIGIFGLLPVLMSLQLSFQKSDLLSDETPWVGFDNYKKLADDPVFVEAIKHTIVYTALFVPGTMLVGLFIAAALNRSVRFISVYRTAAYITMAVRCAPPGNKPLPEEITRCLDHLTAEVAQLTRTRVVVALGKIAFDAWLLALKRRGVHVSPRPRFGHGAVVACGGDEPVLLGCYHPSRQNTNTGVLTAEMLALVFERARNLIEK